MSEAVFTPAGRLTGLLCATALASALLSGCVALDGQTIGASSVTNGTALMAGRYPWLEDPQGYARAVAAAETSGRARERQEAIAHLLRDPRAESGLRLQLVFAAAVQSVEEAYEAREELDSAAAQVRSPVALAALTSAALSTERYQQSLRAGIEAQNLLNVERESVARAEAASDRLARELLRLRDALDEAQGKVRALMSIEEQLQEGT